jgi:F-type H+-transporting ATPase subunit b
MEIIQTNALISINETLWVQLLLFLVFMFVVNRLLVRPVQRNMAAREKQFEGLSAEVAAIQSEMKTLVRQLDDESAQTNLRARTRSEDLRRDGQLQADRLIEAAREEIRHQQSASAQELDGLLREARKHLEVESRKVAAVIMSQILEERPRP